MMLPPNIAADSVFFFPIRTVMHWNKLPRELVQPPCLEIFKTRPGKTLSNYV